MPEELLLEWSGCQKELVKLAEFSLPRFYPEVALFPVSIQYLVMHVKQHFMPLPTFVSSIMMVKDSVPLLPQRLASHP